MLAKCGMESNSEKEVPEWFLMVKKPDAESRLAKFLQSNFEALATHLECLSVVNALHRTMDGL
jgi:hypothetical protein